MGTGQVWVRKILPTKKPVPMVQVWVLVGTGMGMAENTHGLPVQNTKKDME
jgi:hypothetical protein